MFAFIDDHSRAVMGARRAFHEDVVRLAGLNPSAPNASISARRSGQGGSVVGGVVPS
jgi:hypothetical protein